MEGAARGAGWPWGVVGVQLGAGATSDASIPAILVVGMVHVRMHAKICRLHAILGRSVGPWRCSMRAYAFPIAALHSGMRVVCVRVRENITSPPPSRGAYSVLHRACVCVILVRTGTRYASPRCLPWHLHLHDTRVPRLRRSPSPVCVRGSIGRVGFVLDQHIAVPR